jgi:predicted outer membrane protein
MKRLTLACLVATMTTALFAQDPTQPPRANPATPPATETSRTTAAGMNTVGDEFLATCLAIGNDNEIALAELAVQRSQNAQVKEFARKMIDDHKKMGEKLRPLAAGNPTGRTTPPTGREETPAGTGTRGTEPGRDNTGRETGGAPGTDEGRKRTDARPAGETSRSTSLGGSIDAIALERELGRQCLESSRKELEKKQGDEFDKCYVGMAIGAHAKTLDKMTVFSRHASDRLRSVIQEGQPVVQQHLEHAKSLCKQLEGKAGADKMGADHKDHKDNKDNRENRENK